jgi:colicin import membrane protein
MQIKHLNMQTKYFNLAISGLAILASVTMAHGQQNPDPARPPRAFSIHNSYMHVETDSSVNPPQTVITYREKQFYAIRTVDDKIIELSVNGRKIPSDSFYVYDAMVRRIEVQIKRDRLQAEEDSKQAVRDEEQAKRDEEQAVKDEDQARSDARQAEQDAQVAARDAEEAKREAEDAKREAIRDRRAVEQSAREDSIQAKRDAEEAKRDADQAKRDAEEARLDAIQARRDEAQAVKDRVQARIDAKHAAEDQARMKSLISELIKEGVVPDEKSLYSLEVSDTDLIINGKKQTEEMRKRLCTQFKIGPGYCISFHQ